MEVDTAIAGERREFERLQPSVKLFDGARHQRIEEPLVHRYDKLQRHGVHEQIFQVERIANESYAIIAQEGRDDTAAYVPCHREGETWDADAHDPELAPHA